ncbi:hypothetical protein APT65_00061 [Trabzonvirus APT65]|uniref:Uncharacterized protein n=1 Tax=Aeromonas phage APT65 TaxID=2982914 RepID=A0A9E8K2C5_9CAUD|nr:hypothetical protein APT65_00061 [Aeromonas phage APT65]
MSNEFMNANDKLQYDKLIIEEQELKNELLKLQILRNKQEIQQHRSVWGGLGVLSTNHLDIYPKVMFNGPSDYPLGNQVTAIDCSVDAT